jgi:hypothetical protein
VNKKGGPDKRFKDNRQIPICAYDLIGFESASGLKEVLQVSRPGVGEAFKQTLKTLTAHEAHAQRAQA